MDLFVNSRKCNMPELGTHIDIAVSLRSPTCTPISLSMIVVDPLCPSGPLPFRVTFPVHIQDRRNVAALIHDP